MRNGERPILSDRLDADQVLAESKNRPQVGRIYDYCLGGTENFAVDREFAKKAIQGTPDIPWLATQNRSCLRRMVSYMLDQGVRQFLDLGSGLPTAGNVHQIADAYAQGESRVVYVDNDPIAGAHSHVLLERSGLLSRHRPITANALDAGGVWELILEHELLDPEQPIGLLCVALLHFVSEDPRKSLQYYRQRLVPGSHLAMTHITDELPDKGRHDLQTAIDNYAKATSGVFPRSRADVLELLGVQDGWTLLDPPGLCWTPEWIPEGTSPETLTGDMEPWRSMIIAGLAKKL